MTAPQPADTTQDAGDGGTAERTDAPAALTAAEQRLLEQLRAQGPNPGDYGFWLFIGALTPLGTGLIGFDGRGQLLCLLIAYLVILGHLTHSLGKARALAIKLDDQLRRR